MHRAIAVGIYIVAIVTANVAVFMLGPWWSPFTAFILIGLDLTLRDVLHEQLSRLEMAAMIVAGSCITFLLNPAVLAVAVASAVAFTAAAMVDWTVYHWRRHDPWLVRSNTSNVAGAAADSVLFPVLAFGLFPGLGWVVLLQFLAKVGGSLIWSIALMKTRRA